MSAGEGQAVLPVDARRDTAVGRRPRAGSFGTRRQGEPFRVPCCPDCTAQIVDKDGVPLTDEDLNRRKHTCANCGSPLWQADKSGPARYPLADYVKHRMKGFFDLLIGDEVHEYKGRGSGPGHRRRQSSPMSAASRSACPGR